MCAVSWQAILVPSVQTAVFRTTSIVRKTYVVLSPADLANMVNTTAARDFGVIRNGAVKIPDLAQKTLNAADMSGVARVWRLA